MQKALRKQWWVVVFFGVLGVLASTFYLPGSASGTGTVGTAAAVPVLIIGAVGGAILGALAVVVPAALAARRAGQSSSALAKAAPSASTTSSVSQKAASADRSTGETAAGQSAFAARQFGFISSTSKLLLAQAAGVLAILSILLKWPSIVSNILVPIALVLFVLAIVGRTMERRAMKRERDAGYTTLNGTELDLEQRHPRTGEVIRRANAAAIPIQKFKEMLGSEK
jgi:hypothetical protein